MSTSMSVVVVGQVDEGEVRRVARAVPGQLDAFAADVQRAAVLERLLRRRPGRVIVPQQEPPGLLVPDANDLVEQRGRAGVVGVMVRVDEVRDFVAHAVRGGDLVHGPLQIVADGGRRVEQDDAVRRGQEGRLVHAVGDPVQVPLGASDVVPLVVERGAERRGRDRCVIRQNHVGCRFLRAHRVLPFVGSWGQLAHGSETAPS
jgi:hypothetical protein